MKIGFICGSLEEGKDGVGDYVRKFSSELIRMGHEVMIAAVADQFVAAPFSGNQQYSDIDIRVLRLPSSYKFSDRLLQLEQEIKAFNPDWLSLQFVPFSFDPKGLTFLLGNKLKKMFPTVNWHIMFHELWVGMKSGSSLKLKIWGELQKLLIKNMIGILQPKQIQTQTHLYLAYLEQAGFKASLLPLFGNIPLITNRFTDTRDKKKIELLHFGSIYPNAPVKQFAKDMAQYSKKAGQHITLTILGRSGPEKNLWITSFTNQGLEVRDLGEKSVNEIAEIFAVADFGIATTACALIEKSGSVAAMHEFGLPVICVSEAWKPAQNLRVKQVGDIFEYQNQNLEDFMYARHKSPYVINVSVVANLFLNTLAETDKEQLKTA